MAKCGRSLDGDTRLCAPCGERKEHEQRITGERHDEGRGIARRAGYRAAGMRVSTAKLEGKRQIALSSAVQ